MQVHDDFDDDDDDFDSDDDDDCDGEDDDDVEDEDETGTIPREGDKIIFYESRQNTLYILSFHIFLIF